MADATTAAKDRIDRALAALERKLGDLKSRQTSARASLGGAREDLGEGLTDGFGDDELFAPRASDGPFARPSDGADYAEAKARIAALEEAGRDASAALARAADQLRAILTSPARAEGAD